MVLVVHQNSDRWRWTMLVAMVVQIARKSNLAVGALTRVVFMIMPRTRSIVTIRRIRSLLAVILVGLQLLQALIQVSLINYCSNRINIYLTDYVFVVQVMVHVSIHPPGEVDLLIILVIKIINVMWVLLAAQLHLCWIQPIQWGPMFLAPDPSLHLLLQLQFLEPSIISNIYCSLLSSLYVSSDHVIPRICLYSVKRSFFCSRDFVKRRSL